MITGMIMKYVYIGLFGLLFLVGAVVVMYYKRAYRIVRVSRRGSIELKQTKKQHDFVDDAIRSIIQSRDEAERRLVLLQNTWDTELLWDVCVRGIMTAAEGRNVDRLLEGISEQYVVVLIADREESENRKLIVWLEEFMRVFCPTGVSLFPNGVSMAFIAPLSRQADYDCLLEHVKRLDGACRAQFSTRLQIGISKTHSRTEELHGAYEEARLALRVHQVEIDVPCIVYGRDVIGKGEPFINTNMLSKFTDLLIMGEDEEIERLFDEIITSGYGKDDSVNRYMYIFSAIRMAMLTASQVIVKGEEYVIPSYRVDESIEVALGRQKESALRLCQIACSRKKSNNTLLLNSIVEYISINFPDVNLSADQLAQHFGLLRSYIQQFIQMQLGKTLNDYIESVRLEYVEQYLLGTDWSVDQIMAATGYVSQNTLYRAFKKKHGVTPGRWRESHRKRSAEE